MRLKYREGVFLIVLAGFVYFNLFDLQIDLSSDQRYSISKAAKEVFTGSDKPITITMLLEGNLPASFAQFKEYIDSYLSEIQRANSMITLEFRDPNAGSMDDVRQLRGFLKEMGLDPITRRVASREDINESLIYPFLSLNTGEKIVFVDLLEAKNPGQSEEEALLLSQSRFEGKIVRAFRNLNLSRRPHVGILGHNPALLAEGLSKNFRDFENMDFFPLNENNIDFSLIDSINCLLVAIKGTNLSRKEQLFIDQAFIRGTPLISLVDKYTVDLDSLRIEPNYLASPFESNYDDMLFKWGLRIQNNLIADIQSGSIPQVTGTQAGQARTEMIPYPYHVLVRGNENEPVANISGNMNFKFVSAIDSSFKAPNQERQDLLRTSNYSRLQSDLVGLNFNFLRVFSDPTKFSDGSQLIANKTEGVFESYFRNRIQSSDIDLLTAAGTKYFDHTDKGTIFLVSDLDFILPMRGENGRYFPPGFNIWDNYPYTSNVQLLSNMIESALFGNDILSLSKKDLIVSILDKKKLQENKPVIALVSVLLPLVIFLILGISTAYWRRKRYAQPKNYSR